MSNGSNLIWIDTTSGTWGNVDGTNGVLVLVDLDQQAKEDTAAGVETDADSLYSFLHDSSDSEVTHYGLSHGLMPMMPTPKPNATLEDVEVATLIDALAHYRDALRAEGMTGNAVESVLHKVTGLVNQRTYGLTLIAERR